MKYAMLICGRGDYASRKHTDSAWSGTMNKSEMESVEADSAASAMDAFIERFGISAKYRDEDGASATNANLHEFIAIPMDDI